MSRFFDSEGHYIPPDSRSDPNPQPQKDKKSPVGLTGKASIESKSRSSLTDISNLVPNWEKRRQTFRIRLKTLAKIFLSKWFYHGLEYYEKELLLIVLQRLGLHFPILFLEIIPSEWIVRNRTDAYQKTEIQIERNVIGINLVGLNVLDYIFTQDEKRSLDQKGFQVLENLANLHQYLYSEDELYSVWKLRSFQSLYDSIFQPLRHEHVGKKHVQKTRKRGYTDGRGSPRDTCRTLLAYRADVIFWEQKFEQRWEDFFSDVEKLCQT
jgi:hypothetical protein